MARPHFFKPLLANGDRRHTLVNRSRGLVLATTVEAAFDSRARRTGLLGRQTLPADTVLAIAPSNAVHTFGMKFPIDVLYVDREGRIVKRVLGLRAWRVSAALGAFAVLEFAAGSPAVARSEVGDQVAIE